MLANYFKRGNAQQLLLLLFFIISKVIINVNFNYLVTFVINDDFEIKKTLKNVHNLLM